MNTNEIDGFYEQISKLKEFIEKILTSKGKSVDLLNETYLKLLLFKKANKRGIIEVFYIKYVNIYYEMIINRDDNFFVEKVKSEINDESHMGILSEIHNIWNELDNNTKKSIWKYIHVICILSERIQGGNTMINRLNEIKNKL